MNIEVEVKRDYVTLTSKRVEVCFISQGIASKEIADQAAGIEVLNKVIKFRIVHKMSVKLD